MDSEDVPVIIIYSMVGLLVLIIICVLICCIYYFYRRKDAYPEALITAFPPPGKVYPNPIDFTLRAHAPGEILVSITKMDLHSWRKNGGDGHSSASPPTSLLGFTKYVKPIPLHEPGHYKIMATLGMEDREDEESGGKVSHVMNFEYTVQSGDGGGDADRGGVFGMFGENLPAPPVIIPEKGDVTLTSLISMLTAAQNKNLSSYYNNNKKDTTAVSMLNVSTQQQSMMQHDDCDEEEHLTRILFSLDGSYPSIPYFHPFKLCNMKGNIAPQTEIMVTTPSCTNNAESSDSAQHRKAGSASKRQLTVRSSSYNVDPNSGGHAAPSMPEIDPSSEGHADVLINNPCNTNLRYGLLVQAVAVRQSDGLHSPVASAYLMVHTLAESFNPDIPPPVAVVNVEAPKLYFKVEKSLVRQHEENHRKYRKQLKEQRQNSNRSSLKKEREGEGEEAALPPSVFIKYCFVKKSAADQIAGSLDQEEVEEDIPAPPAFANDNNSIQPQHDSRGVSSSSLHKKRHTSLPSSSQAPSDATLEQLCVPVDARTGAAGPVSVPTDAVEALAWVYLEGNEETVANAPFTKQQRSKQRRHADDDGVISTLRYGKLESPVTAYSLRSTTSFSCPYAQKRSEREEEEESDSDSSSSDDQIGRRNGRKHKVTGARKHSSSSSSSASSELHRRLSNCTLGGSWSPIICVVGGSCSVDFLPPPGDDLKLLYTLDGGEPSRKTAAAFEKWARPIVIESLGAPKVCVKAKLYRLKDCRTGEMEYGSVFERIFYSSG